VYGAVAAEEATQLRIGIIGARQSGKTSLFTAVTGVHAPPGDITPRLGVVHVPDARLDRLVEMESSAKRTPPEVTFVDMVAMSEEGRGQSEDFVKWIRDADAFVVVAGGASVETAQQALDSLDYVLAELVISDLVSVEKRIERVDKEIRLGRKQYERERAKREVLRAVLDRGEPLRASEEAREVIADFAGDQFLSERPVAAVFNRPQSRRALDAETLAGAAERGLRAVCFDVALEAELLELEPEERGAFMEAEDLEALAAERVVRLCYETLDLVTFYTAGPKESRAISVRQGTSACEAAGKIHTDIQHGFQRAEAISYDALIQAGSWNAAKSGGHLRLEGRDYTMRDGAVVYFRFTS